MSVINDILKIKSITLPNRIGMSPMCMYMAVDGMATDWHFVHYGTRAVGGMGLILLEATAVAPEGRITPFDLGLWHDGQIEPLKKITNFVHSVGGVCGIQIAHAGRKASHDKPVNGGKQLNIETGGWETVAPSAIPFDESEIPPHELSLAEIDNIVNLFKRSALRALKSGFKVLEIHAAHGYLIHQFLSPISNKRTDSYGGSFENRISLLLKILDAVKLVWDINLPIFVRLSATDWTLGGWTLDDTIKLSEILHINGVDLIDCSSGGNVSTAKIPLAPGYQVAFAESIRATGILTSTVGLINSTSQINAILEAEKADLVLLGRELLRNPYFPLQDVFNNVNDNFEIPTPYLRAKK